MIDNDFLTISIDVSINMFLFVHVFTIQAAKLYKK